MTKQIYALLVGINQYHPKSEDVTTLRGCANDVNAMKALLQTQYAVPEANLLALHDEAATRDGIIAGFRQHLTAQGNADTTLLFYFSGHGSQQSMPPAFQQYGGTYRKDQTLVCYDSRAKEDGEWLSWDLSDKETAMLIEEAANTGAHVVIILDCCHSGSGTRTSHEAALDDFTEVREVKPRNTKAALKRQYLDGYYEKMLETQGHITLPTGKHILLAASQRDQYSLGKYFGDEQGKGAWRGVFTYHLEQVLRENPRLSYGKLYTLVRARVRQYLEKKYPDPDNLKPQNPQFETYNYFNAHSYFLSGALPSPEELPSFGVQRASNGEWFVKQGLVHGLPPTEANPRLEWLIYEPQALDKPLTKARTLAVSTHLSIIAPALPLDPQKSYLAVLMSLSMPPMLVGINTQDLAIDSPHAWLEQNPAHALQVNLQPSGFSLSERGKTLYENFSLEPATIANIIKAKLAQIARWQLLFDNQNLHTHLNPADFVVHFKVGENSQALYQTNEGLVMDGGKYPDPEYHWKIPYEIAVQNNSRYEVHFMFLHFGADYSITEYPQGSALSHKDFDKSAAKLTLFRGCLVADEPNQPCVDYFKLVVSTSPFEAGTFAQEGVGASTLYGIKRNDHKVADDWLVKTIRVEVKP